MSRAIRLAGLLLLVLALAAVLVYLAAGAWLESAGGRGAVERELSRRAGVPVGLLGDFDIMLFPSIGVEGTDLVIGGSEADDAFLHSRSYSVALEARPLLAGELRVRSIRLARGALRLDRVPIAEPPEAPAPDGAFWLPAIESLNISEFTIEIPGEPARSLVVDEFAIEKFEERRDTKFRIEADNSGQVAGTLNWDSRGALLKLDATAIGLVAGDLDFTGSVNFTTSNGSLMVRWPAGPRDIDAELLLSAGFELLDNAIRLADLELTASGQSVRGEGCVLMGEATSLRLLLSTDELDLDRLPSFPPLATAPGAGNAAPDGLELAIRLTAGELRKAGAVARNATVSLGGEPDCSQLD